MKEIIQLIEENRFIEARKKLVDANVVDIAHALEDVSREDSLIIFRILPKDISAEVFSYMSKDQKRYIMESITGHEIRNIVNHLYVDDFVDFLEELPAGFVKKLLQYTDENTRNVINEFLKYPEDSAGSIMTIEYVDLKKEMTVKEALEHIKVTGTDRETIDTCYVINESRKLEGIIPLRKLILSDEDVIIKDIMEENIIFVHTLDDQEEVAAMFKRYDLLSMPVVDNENRLVGIITIDDIVDIIELENTEDFQKMAAMQPSEERYLDTSVLTLAKHRVTWLLILMISATFTGNIIQKYENVLESILILAAFIPMLMDTGGNAGSQSSTLIIRGIALGEIELKDIFKILWKEFLVGITVGITLGAANFIRLYFFEKVGMAVSLTVSLSLFITVVMAKVVGGALPLLAKRLNLDPAIMAGPLITTIVDACALLIYFSTAVRLLHI